MARRASRLCTATSRPRTPTPWSTRPTGTWPEGRGRRRHPPGGGGGTAGAACGALGRLRSRRRQGDPWLRPRRARWIIQPSARCGPAAVTGSPTSWRRATAAALEVADTWGRARWRSRPYRPASTAIQTWPPPSPCRPCGPGAARWSSSASSPSTAPPTSATEAWWSPTPRGVSRRRSRSRARNGRYWRTRHDHRAGGARAIRPSSPGRARPTMTVPGATPSWGSGPATPVKARPTSAPSTRPRPFGHGPGGRLGHHRPVRYAEHVELDLGRRSSRSSPGTTAGARPRRRAARRPGHR